MQDILTLQRDWDELVSCGLQASNVPFTIDNHSYFTLSCRKPMRAACTRLIAKVHVDSNLNPPLKLDDESMQANINLLLSSGDEGIHI